MHNAQLILVGISLAVFLMALWLFRCDIKREADADAKASARMPLPGERWQNRESSTSGDPWEVIKHWEVRILDAKEGWVRYSMSDSIFSDERMKADMFTYIYEPLERSNRTDEPR